MSNKCCFYLFYSSFISCIYESEENVTSPFFFLYLFIDFFLKNFIFIFFNMVLYTLVIRVALKKTIFSDFARKL